MRPEDVDLREVTEWLACRLAESPPRGYLRGKALMRDALSHGRGLSELEAEDLVDTLELNGFLRFLGDRSERSVADAPWELHARGDQGPEQEPSVEVQPPEPGQVVKITDEER